MIIQYLKILNFLNRSVSLNRSAGCVLFELITMKRFADVFNFEKGYQHQIDSIINELDAKDLFKNLLKM